MRGTAVRYRPSHPSGTVARIGALSSSAAKASSLLVPGLLCLVLLPAKVGAADTPAGSLAAGEQLFLAQCAGCHGQHGAGDGPAVSFLYPRPRNFIEQPFKLGGSQEDVVRVISSGIPVTSMPAFTAVLAPSDIDALASYVRSLAGESAVGLPIDPVVVPDPVGSVSRGQKIYAESCTNCHGEGGEGDGPAAG